MYMLYYFIIYYFYFSLCISSPFTILIRLLHLVNFFWKKRYGPGLILEAVAELPDRDVVTMETALPSSIFPSDHVHLKATFILDKF